MILILLFCYVYILGLKNTVHKSLGQSQSICTGNIISCVRNVLIKGNMDEIQGLYNYSQKGVQAPCGCPLFEEIQGKFN